MQRVLKVLLLILTVVVVGAVGYVLSHSDSVPHAGQLPAGASEQLGGSTADTTAADRSTTAATTSTTTSVPARTTTLRTVFLGDDWVGGSGATSRSHAWPALLAADLKLKATLDADDGAGYAKTAPDGRSYADLVDRATGARPQLIVVSGGRNDTVDDTGTLVAHAKTLFADLRAGAPKATLVAVAPFWGDSKHPAELGPVDSAVKAGVTAAGGTYLDVADPLRGHADWMADSANPNDRGHKAIAAAVAAALAPLLPS